MEEKLIQYLDEIIEALRQGVEFAGQQAPLFIQEILSYYTFKYAVLTILFFLLFISSAGLSVYFYKKYKEDKNSGWEVWSFFGGVWSVVMFLFGMGSGFDLAKVLLAPRLFIIEKISYLL